MTGSDEKYITCTESAKKKKKQKHDESGKSIVKESQCHSNKNKKKKKAIVTEDASEIADIVPKKKDKALDEDIASCNLIINDVPKKKKKKHDESGKSIVKESQCHNNKNKKKKKAIVTEDALEIADIVPKKKKDKALDEDVASRDLIMNDVPKKKKKKNIVDDVLESVDPLHKKEKHSTVEESKEIVTKKKKYKRTEGNLEDGATKTQNIGTDVSVGQKKKKKVSVLEEHSGYPKDDQPKVSDYTEAKKIKKKKKTDFVQSEDDVIDGHDVHNGREDGESLRVSQKKKKRKLSITDERYGHGDSDLNGNRDEEYDYIFDGASKKKKRNKAKETAELADGADESLHVTCHEEEKQKSKRKKKEKMLKDEAHSAHEDTTEVPKKKQKNKEGTKTSNKSSKKREEHTDFQPESAQDGSTDEVHIHKGTKFGQWDTATFQNPEQQTKFLRLLGGFKKGNQANLMSTSNQVKANMAMGKQGEQVLERSLQAEFDKALSWKENRGIGLGFQPAPNNSFYIDKSASRSVKFED
ncbi:lysine-rich nucleolar protein 1 isoform X1 [Phyllobates terribilis]|uniref:lysine-rich nucleolar protein 1 isoform X1 n=1 Tax=Phyllobates terribilis TaxID=111132 RepID=UPI003CCB1299